MIKDDFDQSLASLKQAIKDKYPEQTKCYCGHTTYCDCGPDITLEEYYLSGIKNMLLSSNDTLAMRLMENYFEAKKVSLYGKEDMKKAFNVGFQVGYHDNECPSYLTFEEWIKTYVKT